MSNTEFELNLAGLNELMKSSEMQAHLETASARVAELAGNGFGHRVGIASYTAIGNVFAEKREAAKKAYKDNTLLKALGSSGLEAR
jgi:hypothetical protein